MKRRSFLTSSALAFAAPALVNVRRAAPDLILRGGTVIDGTGRPRFQADVAITGDRITAIAARIADSAGREIDCRGHVVAPGFVDIHSHGDGTLSVDPMMEGLVRQGVTTIVVGADGSSQAPRENYSDNALVTYPVRVMLDE